MDDLRDKKAEPPADQGAGGRQKQLATAEAKLQNENNKAPQNVIDG
ncbi:MAG: hypothetical protein ACLRSY_08935 [Acutalibacter sp.]